MRDGLAFAVMPRSAFADIELAGVTARRILESTMSRVQCLAWRLDQPLTPAGRAVADALLQVIGQLTRQGLLLGSLIDSKDRI